MLLSILDNLNTYEKLAAYYLILDTELRRIEEINPKKRLRANNKPTISTPFSIAASTAKAPFISLIPKVSPSSNRYVYYSTSANTVVIYYNYDKLRYYASFYPELKKANFKAIEEELFEYNSKPEKDEP